MYMHYAVYTCIYCLHVYTVYAQLSVEFRPGESQHYPLYWLMVMFISCDNSWWNYEPPWKYCRELSFRATEASTLGRAPVIYDPSPGGAIDSRVFFVGSARIRPRRVPLPTHQSKRHLSITALPVRHQPGEESFLSSALAFPFSGAASIFKMRKSPKWGKEHYATYTSTLWTVQCFKIESSDMRAMRRRIHLTTVLQFCVVPLPRQTAETCSIFSEKDIPVKKAGEHISLLASPFLLFWGTWLETFP